MEPGELLDFLQHMGRDPSRLIFEDELTGIHNRRFLHSYLEHKVRWKGDADYPLSLLIIDLDQFKAVNDTHGHATGDQLLTWVATVLAEVGGEQGLPVRFGGDEFILLLPKTDRDGAREMAARLLQRTRDRPFRLRDAGVAVPITLSIGVATAPADGTSSRGLLQAADTALYHAKQSGRNQAASAAEVDPKKVFPRTALHRLVASGIAGRDTELRVVSDSLVALSRGENQFLMFEGAPGIGKSTFLETIGRNLAGDETYAVTKVSGDPQEAYRPYHLTTRLLVALLNQREDRGAAVVQSLSGEEVALISQILPQVTDASPAAPAAADGAKRQRIFAALARFLPRVVDFRPLVLIIDDLQFADEATLLLLRALLQSRKLPLFLCGATVESLKLGRDAEAPPLERFYAARQRELGIRRFKLGPLNTEAIGDYLRSVFPNLRMPDGFEAELARTTQGNPLFLGEVIRKLVGDGKVTLVGQEWVIEPLGAGYLPRSLEDVVMQKIAALDAESRKLLERATTLGEDVPVSVLAGSAELDETRVLEFLDRAEALGLVSLGFQLNDDVMRFLGKRVLEISYGAIDPNRRRELHEHVGTYQEGLYRQRFLPSASLLAYHFKRSANEEKARRYERAQLAYAQTVFDPDEAAKYSSELLEEEGEAEGRLTPESLALVPNVLRAVMMAVRSIQLYPPESKALPQSLQQVHQAVEEVLAKSEWLHLSQDRRVLLANGQRLGVSELSVLADSFLELLTRAELQGIMFQRGVTEQEIGGLLTALATLKPEALDPGFWKRAALERGLAHVQAQQVRYSKILRVKGPAPKRSRAEEEELGPEDLAEIPKIARAFHTAAKNVKLYPLESEPVAQAIAQFHEALQGVLSKRQALTLAGVDQSLLANGVRVDTAGFEAAATNLLALMESLALRSLTFYANIPLAELQAFCGALRDVPASGTDKEFWDAFARNQRLACVAFNQRQYAVSVVHGLLQVVEAGRDADAGAADEADVDQAAVEQLASEPAEALRQALPRFGRELLVKGEHQLVRRLLRRLFEDFRDQDVAGRVKTVQACRSLLDRLILGLQHKFAELAADILLAPLATETEPQVLRELAGVLYDLASNAVQFADYQVASRILLELQARHQQLKQTGGRKAEGLAALLDRRLDPAALKILDEDLRAGQPERQERAAQVLGGLGAAAVPLLIDVIKQENDFRTRQLAARLLTELGPSAAEQIKRALATEVIVEQRHRLLEVIDSVTRDLRHELEHSLRDGNPKIRRAAFQLVERLRQDELIELVLPFARHADPGVARGAIRSLTALRTPAAVRALAAVLEATKDPSLATVCCQALGQSQHEAGIDALAKVLRQRKLLVFGWRWNGEVRAMAAMALKQIPHPRAVEVLSRYTHDQDARVRQFARAAP